MPVFESVFAIFAYLSISLATIFCSIAAQLEIIPVRSYIKAHVLLGASNFSLFNEQVTH